MLATVALVGFLLGFVGVLVVLWKRVSGNDKPVPVVFVEGAIAAGKTTATRALAGLLKEVEVVSEPVSTGQDLEGHNDLLRRMSERWGFPPQVLTTVTQWRRLSWPASQPRVVERSPGSVMHVFSADMRDRGVLSEARMAVLRRLHRGATAHVVGGAPHYVYIRVPPEVAFERAARRGRPEEAGLTLEDFQRLHALTERWLLEDETAPVTVVDGTEAEDKVVEELERAVRRVFSLRA